MKLEFNFAKVKEFSECMRWREEVGVDVGGDIDIMNNLLVSAITDVAAKLGIKRIVNHRNISTPANKPWFDDECRNARSSLKASFREYRDRGFEVSLRGKFIEAQSKFRKLIIIKREPIIMR